MCFLQVIYQIWIDNRKPCWSWGQHLPQISFKWKCQVYLARWVILLWTKWLDVQYMTGWREEGQRNVSGWPTWACADARLKTNEPKKVTSDHPLLPVPLWETGGVEQKLLPTDYRGALSCEKKDLGFQTFHFEVHIRFIPQAPTSHVWVTLITGLRSCEPAAVISQCSEVVGLYCSDAKTVLVCCLRLRSIEHQEGSPSPRRTLHTSWWQYSSGGVGGGVTRHTSRRGTGYTQAMGIFAASRPSIDGRCNPWERAGLSLDQDIFLREVNKNRTPLRLFWWNWSSRVSCSAIQALPTGPRKVASSILTILNSATCA